PIALPVDGSADEIGLAVTVRRNGNGKPLAVVVADVALAAVLPPSAVAGGRVVAILDPRSQAVASFASGEDPAIGDRVLRLAGEIGSGSATSVAVPFTAGPLRGWSLAVSDQPPPTALPLPALAALALLTALLVGLAVWMARQVIAPAVELEASRQRLGELYDAAQNAARVDFLTNLGNHRAFQEELDRQVAGARRYHTPLALLLIDLDEFKPVNDTLGHAVGDDLLAEIGDLIRATMRTADAGFRTGGDEFAIILPQTDGDGAEELGRRLLTRCLEERREGRYRRPISFSAGVSAYPDGANGRLQLYAQADAALYRSKRAGRTTISRFNPEQDRSLIDEHLRAELRSRLAAIIDGRTLTALYQPIFHLGEKRLLGVEALVRSATDDGFAGAGGLFEAAHVTGQIVGLDRAALDVVTEHLEALPPEVVLTLNLSPRSFESGDFSAAALLRILGAHGMEPGRVILELTEREQISDIDRVRAAIDSLRAAGMRVAADDVGAGNAGLRLLSQIQFDVVKIDLSLIQANARREPVSSVLSSLVDLANRWGALTIAEGIETAAQLETVRSIGVDAAQGYFLGRPSPLPVAVNQPFPTTTQTFDFSAALDARRRLARAAG
ncbi:MAG TPA: EAL domain-containing protein, partial [Candidatus Limnocylindrales bacterium]|nr:EAL domain-containing protein [Candidatus Limnocylindrales bacterium]